MKCVDRRSDTRSGDNAESKEREVIAGLDTSPRA